MTTVGRRQALAVLGLLLTLGVWAAAGVPAQAHNALRSTAPVDGQRVAAVPAAVELVFDEPAIALGTQLVITGPDGPVQLGAPQLVDTTVRQEIAPGAPAGPYEVRWRVTSVDGHPVSGTFRFTADAPGSGSPLPVTSSPSAEPPPAGSAGGFSADAAIPAWAWVLTVVVAAIALGSIGYHVWQRRRA